MKKQSQDRNLRRAAARVHARARAHADQSAAASPTVSSSSAAAATATEHPATAGQLQALVGAYQAAAQDFASLGQSVDDMNDQMAYLSRGAEDADKLRDGLHEVAREQADTMHTFGEQLKMMAAYSDDLGDELRVYAEELRAVKEKKAAMEERLAAQDGMLVSLQKEVVEMKAERMAERAGLMKL